MNSPKPIPLQEKKQQPSAPLVDRKLIPLGKVQPQAIEIEEAVLGALMLEKMALTTVIDILTPESFYVERHAKVYEAIVQLFQKSEPVDLMTVVAQLQKDGTLDLVGGSYGVAKLTEKVNSAANIEYHARIILEKAIKRELIRISAKVQEDAFDDTEDVFELLDRTESALFGISEANTKKKYANMQQLMHEAITEIEARKEHTDGLTGVPSGFTELDRVTAGWQPSDLIIMAARPGMGKTAFVVSAMRNAAIAFDKPVAIFSLEMSSIQLVNRMISAEAELVSDKLKKGDLEEHEWLQMVHKTVKLAEAKIFIDDTPALGILELRAKCRRLKAEHDVQVIVVDYLQLMTGDTSKTAGGNREQEIASISRALKSIAKELNIPVIALSQLSRAVETRGGNKRPVLSDLRESGSIEQDADMVLFLYRPEYYEITEDEDGNPTAGMGEVIIAKHRNGALQNIKLKFIGKYTKFTDWDGTFVGGDFSSTHLPADYGKFPASGLDEESNTVTYASKANEPEQEASSTDSSDEPQKNPPNKAPF